MENGGYLIVSTILQLAKSPGYLFNRRLRSFLEQSVRYGLQNNLFLLADIEKRLLCHPARSLVNTLTTLSPSCMSFFFLNIDCRESMYSVFEDK